MSRKAIGIEMGSTRIKAVLINERHKVLASGGYEWENQLVNGVWSYRLEDVWTGIQECYRSLAEDVWNKYQQRIERVDAIGISAMMHGYLAFDGEGNQLTAFRTWRNTMTEQSADTLTRLFGFNIPQRWSIAHLYQAVLNGEEHVKNIRFLTTLSGYVHWKLTGEKVLGIGDASGMFPIDEETKDYNGHMLAQFDELIKDRRCSWHVRELLPKVLTAGESGGVLTKEGALLLDPGGYLQAGIPLCPPEGDAGTGMVATNSVRKRTGNVSAGTSIFGMVVLEKKLSGVYRELDLCTTPDGSPVAMAHCNNCTSDLNAWMGLFREMLELFGVHPDSGELFQTLYKKSLEGDKACGGLLTYNYLSGEHITNLNEGRPLFVRRPDSPLTLADFMRANIYSCFGALKTGLDILRKEEAVELDEVMGHGGLFKTEGVAQSYLAAALDTPVTVMKTAGEGGAWGIAILAMYLVNRAETGALPDYLSEKVFADMEKIRLRPSPEDVKGFDAYAKRYSEGLAIERAAVEFL